MNEQILKELVKQWERASRRYSISLTTTENFSEKSVKSKEANNGNAEGVDTSARNKHFDKVYRLKGKIEATNKCINDLKTMLEIFGSSENT